MKRCAWQAVAAAVAGVACAHPAGAPAGSQAPPYPETHFDFDVE